MVTIGGFDTHNNQNQGAGDINGKHTELLTELSSAVDAFVADINSHDLFLSVMFYQDNKSICAFSLSFHSLSWIRSYNAQFLQFHNQSSGTLWLSSNWKVIFTTAALLCGMIFREELVKSIILPWTCKLSLHFMNSSDSLSGDDIWFSSLMRWWYQSREGERMKCLHLSTYIFPSFSISTFPFPSSCPSTPHLPFPSYPPRRGRLTSSYNGGSFKTKWKQPS